MKELPKPVLVSIGTHESPESDEMRYSPPHYLIHKFLTSSLISWPFNFFTDICIIQRRKKTIKSFLKTATRKSKMVKRRGYQAIQVMREPLDSSFPSAFQNWKPWGRNVYRSKSRWVCGFFQGVFQGQYLPRLGINYVATNKGLEKILPQLY